MAGLTNPSTAALIILAANVYCALAVCRVLFQELAVCFLYQLLVWQQCYKVGTVVIPLSPELPLCGGGYGEVSGLHKVTGPICRGRLKARLSHAKAIALSDLPNRRIRKGGE